MRATLGVLAGVSLAAILAGPALADPWKDESGNHGPKGWHAPSHYYAAKPGKYEWKAGGCKYEYKAGPGGFKEEYKCKGGPYRALLPPQAFVPWGIAPGPHPARYVLGPELALAPDSSYCREYQKQVLVAGRWQEAYGTACRRPDGAWEVMD